MTTSHAEIRSYAQFRAAAQLFDRSSAALDGAPGERSCPDSPASATEGVLVDIGWIKHVNWHAPVLSSGSFPLTAVVGLVVAPDDFAQSPFDILDDRRPVEKKIEDHLNRLRRTPAPFAAKVANRLEQLHQILKEEDPDHDGLSSESVAGFSLFLHANQNLKVPEVVATPSGNIRAEWHFGYDKLCAIEFLPNNTAHFVFFLPSPHNPDETVRMSGIVPVANLIETLSPHGVLRWMTNEE